jgi:hypothetical protein
VGSLSQKFGGRVHTGGTVSSRRAGILYKGTSVRLRLGVFSRQEVWICEGREYGLRTRQDGWQNDGKKCGEVENGDFIVNKGMFEFEGNRTWGG